MEERLVAEYIGKGADEIMNSKTNWVAAILGQGIGPIWFFYRKSYLVGFLFLIITILLGRIASALNIEKAYYIMSIIYLLTANKLYLWDVRRKVRKILAKGDMNMSEDELIECARKKGGTSVLAAVIYVLLFIAFMILYIALMVYAITAMLGM